jgi:hypothetical protein
MMLFSSNSAFFDFQVGLQDADKLDLLSIKNIWLWQAISALSKLQAVGRCLA